MPKIPSPDYGPSAPPIRDEPRNSLGSYHQSGLLRATNHPPTRQDSRSSLGSYQQYQSGLERASITRHPPIREDSRSSHGSYLHERSSMRNPERPPFNRYSPERHSYMGPLIAPKPSRGLQRNESMQGSDLYHHGTRIPLPGLYADRYPQRYPGSMYPDLHQGHSNLAYYNNEVPRPIAREQMVPNVVVVTQPQHQESMVNVPQTDMPRKSVQIPCPRCRVIVKSKLEYSSTKRTHCLAWGCCLCCTPIISCLFYCTPCCRRATHFCPNCKTYLGST